MKSGLIINPPESIIHDAYLIAKQESDCNRLHVGAIIWSCNDGRVYTLGRGANSAPTGFINNCRKDGHLMVNGHCVRPVHAEQKAIAKLRFNCESMYIHITHTPCPHCIKQIIEKGILQITWSESYGNAEGAIAVLKESNLHCGIV